jgi:hypothetical protein
MFSEFYTSLLRESSLPFLTGPLHFGKRRVFRWLW